MKFSATESSLYEGSLWSFWTTLSKSRQTLPSILIYVRILSTKADDERFFSSNSNSLLLILPSVPILPITFNSSALS